MSVVIPAKDRSAFWAWVAWKDAMRRWAKGGQKGPAPARPHVVTVYIDSHKGGIPKLWWTRYAIHVGTPVKPPNPPVPVPPAHPLDPHVQNLIFGAQNPLAALGSPARFGVALTADPAYSEWATSATVAALRYGGHRVYAWGVQTQIPPSMIQALNRNLALDGCIYQSETEEELLTGLAAGGQLFVGNPNAWPARVPQWNELWEQGNVAMSFETYTNEGAPWPNQSSAAGAQVASICIGCYRGGNGDPQPSEYKQHTDPSQWHNVCVYHAAGVTEGWGAL
jgi:hypothetical protein